LDFLKRVVAACRLTRCVSFWRDAPWLTGQRARAYLSLWLVLLLAVAVDMGFSFHAASLAEGGKPVASDFMTFWSASRMAVLHGPAAAYDDAGRVALQRASGAFGGEPGGHYAYWYPPPFLLVSLPLGAFGYVTALCGFLAVGMAVFLACIRRVLRSRHGVIALVASPAMLLNTMIGQNGAVTASCFAGAMLFLESAPGLAGVCLGLLVCKPHLALVIPLGLAAARRWTALLACGSTAAVLCAASYVLLGAQVWRAFLAHSAEARIVLETYQPDWAKIQSVFSAVRLLGGPVALAYGLHAVCAAGAAWVLWRVARARPGAGAEIATLTVCALIATPYMFDYDLTCLLVPMAWIGAAALAGGWRPWEKTVLLLIYALPLAARVVAGRFAVPLIPLPLLALLLLCARRALAQGGRGACAGR
jgi:hypothetical protein